MSDLNYITLEQWRALITVVDTGGYAQAAEVLHKSQSSVTYAVQKIESLLGVKAFEIQGRKAILTPTGQFLYRRAKALLEESRALERAAKRLSAGWEAEIRLSVEILFPTWLLLGCLDKLGQESPHTRIEVIESVMGGTSEALLQGQVDMAIVAQIPPPGFLGTPLIRLRATCVANPEHPLHKLGRPLTMEDLKAQRHILIRESGSKRSTNVTMETAQRWTVSHSATSIEAVRSGYGFAWFPEEKIRKELREGSLKPLPLRDGSERFIQLYLTLADPDAAGPGVLRLAQIIRESVATECAQRGAENCPGGSAPEPAPQAEE